MRNYSGYALTRSIFEKNLAPWRDADVLIPWMGKAVRWGRNWWACGSDMMYDIVFDKSVVIVVYMCELWVF